MTMRTASHTTALVAAFLAAAAAHAQTPAHPPIPSGYTPHRVYDVAAGEFIDFETFARRAADADVVFFGEQHGHSPTHRMQHALLEALARRGDATLSMEMFERDVAHVLRRYVRGDADEATILEDARPWPRYATDYRALVEAARARGWDVIAANVPRDLAALIAREGLAAIDTLAPDTRAHAARDIVCPDDTYRERFIEQMNRHPAPGSEPDDTRSQRYYEAQCVKDETMAESIVAALRDGAPRPIVHVNGQFHSDYGDGAPARTLRRDQRLDIVNITTVPVQDLDNIDPAPHRGRADYLLFTLASSPRTGSNTPPSRFFLTSSHGNQRPFIAM